MREAFTRVEHVPGSSFRYRDMLYFVRFLLPLKWVIAASLALTFVSSLLSTALPLSSKWIIDYLFLRQSIQPVIDALASVGLSFLIPAARSVLGSLPLLISGLAIISLVRYLISSGLAFVNYRISSEYEYRVRMAVFSRVLRYPLSCFKSTRSGYLLARISGDTGKLNMISSGFLQTIITSGAALAVSASVLISLSVPLTALVAVSVPVTVLVSFLALRYSRSHMLRKRESDLRISADGQDMISTIDLIKTHAAEEREIEKYDQAFRNNIALTIASMVFGHISGGMQKAIGHGFKLGIVLYGGTLVMGGRMSVGDYTAFIAMYPQFTGSLSNLFQLPLTLQQTAIAAGSVKELLTVSTECEHEDPGRTLITPAAGARGDIRYDHVYFAYEEDKAVLTDITLDISAGERIGIAGATGAGKTTLVHLLLKFYRPRSGSIFIDDYNLSDLNPSWVREHIALVSQEIMLFHDTIFNNILYSKPDAGKDDVYAAAQSAGIHDEILRFPRRYDTMVGERGGKLSGGQKQRIAIARALLRNSPMIILDEPTSHLDLATEQKLVGEFLRICQGRTTIIITHRESLLQLANRVFEIRNGRLLRRS